MKHGQQHPIETSDPVSALRIMRGSVLAQIEAHNDQGQYLQKQLQAIDHLASLLNNEAPPSTPKKNHRKDVISQAARQYIGVRGGPARLAEDLNNRGITTAYGKRWTAMNARRVIVQAQEQAQHEPASQAQ